MKLLKIGLKTEPRTDMKPIVGMKALYLAHAERLFSVGRVEMVSPRGHLLLALESITHKEVQNPVLMYALNVKIVNNLFILILNSVFR